MQFECLFTILVTIMTILVTTILSISVNTGRAQGVPGACMGRAWAMSYQFHDEIWMFHWCLNVIWMSPKCVQNISWIIRNAKWCYSMFPEYNLNVCWTYWWLSSPFWLQFWPSCWIFWLTFLPSYISWGLSLSSWQPSWSSLFLFLLSWWISCDWPKCPGNHYDQPVG